MSAAAARAKSKPASQQRTVVARPKKLTVEDVRRKAERVQEIAREGKTVRLVSRARRAGAGVSLRVRAEVLDRRDLLASVTGTSNLILFHTDLMGTFGTVSIEPGVEQTAYGVFSDLVNVLENRNRNPGSPA
jgi:homoserine dehydrogenase